MKQITPIIIAILLLAGCGQGAGAGGDLAGRSIRVVTTTSMISDVARIVGGERVTVSGLMGPGVDPHLYKASAGDVGRLQEADVIFYNGLHLEAAMSEVLEQMHTRTKTKAVTDGIDRAILLAPPEFKGAYDPHVWFDVTLWMKATEAIRDTLVEVDPGSAELYKKNAAAYIQTLGELHTYVKQRAEEVPADKRVLVTAHDAFNYFGRVYGFEVRGLQGISTAAEAGTGDMQQMAAFIVERRIPAIFVESSVPPRTIQALQAAVRSRNFEVKIGGQLYSDALGSEGTPAGTYVGMVRANIDTIVTALKK